MAIAEMSDGGEERGTGLDPLALDNQLCFALYAASRSIARVYREALGEAQLTYPQYLVLLVLWEEDGLTIGAIGDRLLLDSGTLTPLLRRMESMGLVTRSRVEQDNRRVRVHLTEQGNGLRATVKAARDEVMVALDMTDTELLRLRARLLEVVDRLERHLEKSETRRR